MLLTPCFVAMVTVSLATAALRDEAPLQWRCLRAFVLALAFASGALRGVIPLQLWDLFAPCRGILVVVVVLVVVAVAMLIRTLAATAERIVAPELPWSEVANAGASAFSKARAWQDV